MLECTLAVHHREHRRRAKRKPSRETQAPALEAFGTKLISPRLYGDGSKRRMYHEKAAFIPLHAGLLVCAHEQTHSIDIPSLGVEGRHAFHHSQRDEGGKTTMKRWMATFLMLCICMAYMPASSKGADTVFEAGEGEPALALRRSANFREVDAPCGVAYLLYADGTLEVYIILARQAADESVLMNVSQVSEAEYQDIERLLNEAKVMDMPDEIPNDVMDGDTVTLTLWTKAGEKSITSQSPDGLLFGEVVRALGRV